jgi:hypothetical protein
MAKTRDFSIKLDGEIVHRDARGQLPQEIEPVMPMEAAFHFGKLCCQVHRAGIDLFRDLPKQPRQQMRHWHIEQDTIGDRGAKIGLALPRLDGLGNGERNGLLRRSEIRLSLVSRDANQSVK